MEVEQEQDRDQDSDSDLEEGPFHWRWRDPGPGHEEWVSVDKDGRTVTLNRPISRGTALVVGDTPFLPDHHYYWEVKMLTHQYGTDTMIGIGTERVPGTYDEIPNRFVSLLGINSESYGYSYNGKTQHCGKFVRYGSRFGMHSLVGVRVDTWHGTVEFYLNRKPLGIAYRDLRTKGALFPMVCSTAAQFSMRLEFCDYRPASLTFYAARRLADRPALLEKLECVPGFRHLLEDRSFWILLPSSDCDGFDCDDSSEVPYPKDFANLFFHQCFPSVSCERSPSSILPKTDEWNFPANRFEESDDDSDIYGDLIERREGERTNRENSADDGSVLKFVGLSDRACEICKVNPASVIDYRRDLLKICLDCFYPKD